MKLPKIIHQIWIGPDEMPKACKEYTAKMKRMHPGWEHILWDNEMVFEGQFKDDPYLKAWKSQINSEYFLQPAFISDRVRLLILNKMGGIYVDVDAIPIRPFDVILDKLSDKVDFFAGVEDSAEYGRIIDITVLGASPKCRVIKKILETNDFPMSGLHMSKDFFKYVDTDMCLFAKDYFYTYGEVNDKTVVLHGKHRMMSWTKMRPEWMD